MARPLVVEMMVQIIQLTQQNVIAVQTVFNPDYWSEVRDGLEGRGHRLFHVVLDCDESILRKRIENDEVESGARDWRMAERFPGPRSEVVTAGLPCSVNVQDLYASLLAPETRPNR